MGIYLLLAWIWWKVVIRRMGLMMFIIILFFPLILKYYLKHTLLCLKFSFSFDRAMLWYDLLLDVKSKWKYICILYAFIIVSPILQLVTILLDLLGLGQMSVKYINPSYSSRTAFWKLTNVSACHLWKKFLNTGHLRSSRNRANTSTTPSTPSVLPLTKSEHIKQIQVTHTFSVYRAGGNLHPHCMP